MTPTARTILLALAVILFAAAALLPARGWLIPAGLALFAGAELVP